MSPSRKSRSTRSSSRRRKKEWYFGTMQTIGILALPAGVDTLAGFWLKPPAGTVDNVSAPFPVLAPEDETLVRMRVQWNMGLQSLSVPSTFENDDFAIGIIRWTDVDDTIPSILDIPFPIESAAADWLWHNYTGVSVISGTGAGYTNYNNGAGPESFVDVRSQRKLSANEGLLAVFEYRNVGVVPAFCTFQLMARMLFLLP